MNALAEKLTTLKKEKDAVIMAHFYQENDIREVADFVGDSFELARRARDAGQSVIILCGVRFMVESAKILNPGKTVYLPAADAGCPMADMITKKDVLELRQKYKDAAVVCYVNSSAAVKAVSDICCTSSSAVNIVRSLPEKRIIFIPDQNLGAYVAAAAPEKEIILFSGFCPIHHRVLAEDVKKAEKARPGAVLAVHPECRPEVLEYADYIGSTAGILDHVRQSDALEFLIGTENGVLEILQKELPHKRFYPLASDFICPDMKKTKLEDILQCLKGERSPVELSEEELTGAAKSLERMVAGK